MNEVHNVNVQFSHSEKPELMEELCIFDYYYDFIIDVFFFTNICNFLLQNESILLKNIFKDSSAEFRIFEKKYIKGK